ncbi:MAG TPA: PD-(D/E)XK nuclease family protein [Patescibacteria group bacterium]|jgi:CRISPR/Cas system-associated exonuclease Cas4 (RecB family)|nr:PD-(D/E)XK nuclease family protein [Patescibacteria group bacterium]
MSVYYNPRRKGNLYDSSSDISFRLSRSKIDAFLKCPRCFYLDRKLGVAQPPPFPFSLNTAVDTLLKKEFDILREKGEPHPLMTKFGIDAIPFQHEKLNEWRDAKHAGITYALPNTNLIITGGVDDIWQNPGGELIIVDYKATSKEEEVSLDAEWQIGYKRQMEIYQWLFRMNNFKVAKTGYFVYCNGKTDGDGFDAKLEFDIKILPYDGDDSWVEKAVLDAYECLKGNVIPSSSETCDYCNYRNAVKEVEK